MRKTGFEVLVFVVMILLLASAAVTAAQKTVEIIAYSQPLLDWYKACGEIFEKQQPGVKMQYQLISYGEYMDTILVRAAGGVLPDLANMMMRFAPTLAEKGLIVDIYELVEKDPEITLEDYFPAFTEHWTYKGQLLGFPMNPSSPVTIYNHDAFQEAGMLNPHEMWKSGTWCWDSALQAAKRLTKDRDGDGNIDQWGYNPTYQWLDWAVGSMIYDGGGVILSDDRSESLVNDPNTVKTLKWIADLYNVHQAGNVNVTASSEACAFGTGVPMHAVRNARNYKHRYGITVIPPRTTDVDPASVIIGPGHTMFNKADISMTWEYMKFLGSQKAAELLVQIDGRLPALRTGAEYWIDAYEADNPEDHIQAIGFAKTLPYNPKWWTEIRPILVEGFKKIFTGEAAAEVVANDMDRRIDAILQKVSRGR